jgi:hypothetical protein
MVERKMSILIAPSSSEMFAVYKANVGDQVVGQ